MSGALPDPLTALTPVVEALEQLGVGYHVGGSLASSAYGLPRSTADVDVIAELRPEDIRPLFSASRGTTTWTSRRRRRPSSNAARST